MAPRSEALGPSKTIGYRRSRAQIPSERKRDGRERRGSDASWRRIWERSRSPKFTGPTFERQLTAPAAAAGATIATAAGPPQPQGDHKTRSRIDNIACYQWAKDRITRLGSPRYRVNPPRLNPNRPKSADRAPRADLRGLGPCSLQIVAIKMV